MKFNKILAEIPRIVYLDIIDYVFNIASVLNYFSSNFCLFKKLGLY